MSDDQRKFGVEIEFLYELGSEYSMDIVADLNVIATDLSGSLAQLSDKYRPPIAVIKDKASSPARAIKWYDLKDGVERNSTEDGDKLKNYLCVSREVSLSSEQSTAFPAEISTPASSLAETEALVQICCRTLHAELSKKQLGTKGAYLNQKCALHVHVSMGFETAKKVCAAVFLSEGILFSFCDWWSENKSMSGPLREYSRLNDMGHRTPRNSTEEETFAMLKSVKLWDLRTKSDTFSCVEAETLRGQLTAILMVRSWEELNQLLRRRELPEDSPDSRLSLAVYVRNPPRFPENAQNTLEFRHMRGTENPDLINAWARIIDSIVQRCDGTSMDQYAQFISQISNHVLEHWRIKDKIELYSGLTERNKRSSEEWVHPEHPWRRLLSLLKLETDFGLWETNRPAEK